MRLYNYMYVYATTAILNARLEIHKRIDPFPL